MSEKVSNESARSIGLLADRIAEKYGVHVEPNRQRSRVPALTPSERAKLISSGAMQVVARPLASYYHAGPKADGLPKGYTTRLAKALIEQGRANESVTKLAQEFGVHPTTLGDALTRFRKEANLPMPGKPSDPRVSVAAAEVLAYPNRPHGFIAAMARKHGVAYTSLQDRVRRELAARNQRAA